MPWDEAVIQLRIEGAMEARRALNSLSKQQREEQQIISREVQKYRREVEREDLATARRISREKERISKETEKRAAEIRRDWVERPLGKLDGDFRGLRDTVVGLSGLGAGFGIAHLVQGTIKTREEMAKLTFGIRAGTGEVVSMQQAQKVAMGVSERWGMSLTGVTQHLNSLRTNTGSWDFTAKSMDKIAAASRASGESIETLSNISATMREKFGIQDIEEPLAAVISLGNQGGISVSELGAALNRVGASAKMAGIQGEEGLKRILGLANYSKGVTGNMLQAMTGVQRLVGLAETGELHKAGMRAGVSGINKSAPFEQQLIEAIAGAGGDQEKLGRLFGKGTPTFMIANALSQEYTQAGGGAKGKARLGQIMEENGRSMITFADLQKEANDAMERAPAKIEAALANLERSMETPQMARLIDSFANMLGPASKKLAEFAEFAVKDPVAATAVISLGSAVMNTPYVNIIAASAMLAYSEVKKIQDIQSPEVVNAAMMKPYVLDRGAPEASFGTMARNATKAWNVMHGMGWDVHKDQDLAYTDMQGKMQTVRLQADMYGNLSDPSGKFTQDATGQWVPTRAGITQWSEFAESNKNGGGKPFDMFAEPAKDFKNKKQPLQDWYRQRSDMIFKAPAERDEDFDMRRMVSRGPGIRARAMGFARTIWEGLQTPGQGSGGGEADPTAKAFGELNASLRGTLKVQGDVGVTAKSPLPVTLSIGTMIPGVDQ